MFLDPSHGALQNCVAVKVEDVTKQMSVSLYES